MSITHTLHQKAALLGKLALRMTAVAGSGHPSSALSLAHLTAHLLYRQMRHDPKNPWHATADRLVLSEGHAVPIVYAAWADLRGAIGCAPDTRDSASALKFDDLAGLREKSSVLDGHPNPAEGFPFFDAATGSLGMGLSVAAGLALAARLDGSDRRVYVLIGDGESREGQIWEAADFIVDHRLSSICAIFNCNGQGQAGPVSSQQSADRLAAKLDAFGWKTEIINGHDPDAIQQAFARFGDSERPTAIVARTVKGWGVDSLLTGNWHGKPLGSGDLDDAYRSLDRAVATANTAPATLAPPPPSGAATLPRPSPREAAWPTFREVMESNGLGPALQKNALATRRAYGATLKAAGDLLPSILCLDADVSNSTFAEIFAKAHPARFFECKIAEQNMVSVAAGLAAAGFIPFVNSFAKFLARAYDQVELASVSRANIKLVGSHSGVTPCSDGPSQMGLLDVAYFRALGSVRGDDRRTPLCWLFQPADAVAAFHCTRRMIEIRGMCYMRTFRPDVPIIYPHDATFSPGGFGVLSAGDDVLLVSAGYMVHVARQAADLLASQNIRAALVDAYSLPIDEESFGELLRPGRPVLVVEDNYGGGLGAAVAEIAARRGSGLRVERLQVNRIPKSAREPDQELDLCGIGARQIADRVKSLGR